MSQQKADNLIYGGKNYKLKSATLADIFSGGDRTSPLHPLLEANDMLQYYASPYLSFHSANMRGYCCDWEIKDDKLFLTSFSSRSKMIQTIDQILGKTPPVLVSEDDIDMTGGRMRIRDRKDDITIFANWFSGSIKAKEFDDYDGKINGLRIEISKGLVVCSTPCHVHPYFSRPLKNYIED
jgi:hypothetical protein